MQAIRQAYGLDQPLPVQYVIWLKNVSHGDLGVSFVTKSPVSQLLGQRIPATLELGIAAMLLSVLLGSPTGIIGAVQSHRTPDRFVSAQAYSEARVETMMRLSPAPTLLAAYT